MKMLTSSQIYFARKRQERLQRIAAAAINLPLSQIPPQPAPKLAPHIVAEPIDQPWPVPAWLEDGKPLSVEKIKRIVARNFGISLADLDSQRRDKRVTFPRQIVCYLAKKLTTNSLPAIGRRLGNRDHTTILHGARKIERMMASDPALAERVASISQRITGGSSEL